MDRERRSGVRFFLRNRMEATRGETPLPPPPLSRKIRAEDEEIRELKLGAWICVYTYVWRRDMRDGKGGGLDGLRVFCGSCYEV